MFDSILSIQKMEAYAIALVACASVMAALIVLISCLACLCKVIRKRKQTSEPCNAVMPSATSTSSVQPAYRGVEKGQTAKKDGEMVQPAAYRDLEKRQTTKKDGGMVVFVASTSTGCGGGGG